MELRFREAGAADLPAIIELIADDEISGDGEDRDPASLAAYQRAFAEMGRQEGNRLIVAEADLEGRPRIVACTQLVVIPGLSRLGMRRAQLEHVRVARDLRGRGVGRRLMSHIIGVARTEGCGMIQLTANVARIDSHRFYESLGFEPTHKGFKLRL